MSDTEANFFTNCGCERNTGTVTDPYGVTHPYEWVNHNCAAYRYTGVLPAVLCAAAEHSGGIPESELHEYAQPDIHSGPDCRSQSCGLPVGNPRREAATDDHASPGDADTDVHANRCRCGAPAHPYHACGAPTVPNPAVTDVRPCQNCRAAREHKAPVSDNYRTYTHSDGHTHGYHRDPDTGRWFTIVRV